MTNETPDLDARLNVMLTGRDLEASSSVRMGRPQLDVALFVQPDDLVDSLVKCLKAAKPGVAQHVFREVFNASTTLLGAAERALVGRQLRGGLMQTGTGPLMDELRAVIGKAAIGKVARAALLGEMPHFQLACQLLDRCEAARAQLAPVDHLARKEA